MARCGERKAVTASRQHRNRRNPPKPSDTNLPNEPTPRIAVLDDNGDIRLLLRAALKRDYIVHDFDNAAELLEFLEREPCDLIVSDLSLPNVDGFDFISALKKNSRLASIPVVAFTAYASDEIRKRALAEGFVAYMVKTADTDQLLSVIAENLAKLS